MEIYAVVQILEGAQEKNCKHKQPIVQRMTSLGQGIRLPLYGQLARDEVEMSQFKLKSHSP